MSVLVQALSIVVRRTTLDARWPGGTPQYLKAANGTDVTARRTCADDTLTSVSFLSAGDAQSWLDHVATFGLVHLSDDRAADIVCIDAQSGPTSPCDWIEWRRHEGGVAHCWLAGNDPGEVVAPDDLTSNESCEPNNDDVPGDEERMLHLAVEDGLEFWLDLATGRQLVELSQQASVAVAQRGGSDSPPPPPSPSNESLMQPLMAALTELGWTPEYADHDTVNVRIAGATFAYALVTVTDDDARLIVCCGLLPILAEPGRRVAIAEVMTRINYALQTGTFDLDFSDGEMRFRVACDVEGGTLTQHMVMSMIGNVCASVDRFGSALMRVLFGAASPEEAAREVLD